MFVWCFLEQFLELYNKVFYYHTYFIDVEPLMEQEEITEIMLLFDVFELALPLTPPFSVGASWRSIKFELLTQFSGG